ncbi:MAG: sigma-54-dependent Fis family transcriptional regulator [Armatimonadota bacterium]|nr:MAG: sigma-54-dependent Fis family transcriptional regulator [Armatimonadota bacterium]
MKELARILVVDDEPNICQVLSAVLRKEGYEVEVSRDGEEALTLLEKTPVDLLITDVIMNNVSGVELLQRVQAASPQTPVVMMTAYGTIKSAVDAIKLGAFDYLAKPFDMDQMKSVVRKALMQRREMRAREPLRLGNAVADDEGALGNIVGRGEWLSRVRHMITKVARSRANVLLRGESGTGKELVARAIHANSSRADRPFVPVACAALSSDLLESELFGHEKGAFTGAIAQKPGRFELADGGTLFLDEIGDISMNLQLKLLRAIQEREFERVGGTRTVHVDVRLIAATNRDLEAAVNSGAFREDLYYRLQVVEIHLPPLRDRNEDVPDLVRHFLDIYNHENDKRLTEVPEAVVEILQEYSWPGNVRELENAIEHACVLADDEMRELTLELMPPTIVRRNGKQPGIAGKGIAAELHHAPQERAQEMLSAALAAQGGDIGAAAKALDLTERAMSYYLAKHAVGTKGGRRGRTGKRQPTRRRAAAQRPGKISASAK